MLARLMDDSSKLSLSNKLSLMLFLAKGFCLDFSFNFHTEADAFRLRALILFSSASYEAPKVS